MASISQGFIKVCRKLNCNIAMDNFIKHYQPRINPSVFQLSPSKLTQHVSDTFIWENWFLTHLAALLWVISILFMLCFVCVCGGGGGGGGRPDWGGILNPLTTTLLAI